MNGSAAAASPALLDKKAAKLKYKEERRRIKEKEKEMKEQKKKEAKEAKKRGKGFVGASISGPTNFSHDTHVGWDMDHGFEVRNIPAEWKRLFMEAGVKKSELQDPETRKAILNAVRQSVYGAPPAPPSGVLGIAGPPPPPAPPAPPAAPGAPAPPPGGVDLAALLQAKANALKTPDLTNMSEQQEGNIVDAIQNALSSRRQGMCYSVYGQDAGQDGWDDDDDESWMDF